MECQTAKSIEDILRLALRITSEDERRNVRPGVLRDKLNQCDWLSDQEKKSLSVELDCVENQLKKDKFYPNLGNALDAFLELREFPKIVIVGTDPYPDGRATGIPFSVPDDYTGQCPNSLKTLNRVFGFERGVRSEWVKWMNDNHVLLLNRALTSTVRAKSFELWDGFVKKCLSQIVNKVAVVWLLGHKATQLKRHIEQFAEGSPDVFSSCHPSYVHCVGQDCECYKCFAKVWKRIELS